MTDRPTFYGAAPFFAGLRAARGIRSPWTPWARESPSVPDGGLAVMPRTDGPGGDDDDSLWHIMCCIDENLGLCGADLHGVEIVSRDAAEPPCIVCEDLQQGPFCPRQKACSFHV